MNEAKKITGVFGMRVYKSGVLINEYVAENLVVSNGRVQVAEMIGGATVDKFVDSISFGTNATAPSSGDTAITAPFNIPVTVSYPAPGTVQFDWDLPAASDNGVTIAEAGLICNDNTLFARKTMPSIAKDSTIRLQGYWKIIF